MNRRHFFTTATGVAGTGMLAGCTALLDGASRQSETESATETITDRIPEDAIDITDHGADPTGSESVVPVLEQVAVDGEAVYFPEGRYLVDETWVLRDFSDFKMFGPEAIIEPVEGFDEHIFRFESVEQPASLQFEGFTYDYTKPLTGGRMIQARVSESLTVRDVSATGVVDILPSLVRLDVTEPGGHGLVERLSLPDGAAGGTRLTGCYVGNISYGDFTFVDCHIANFPDNGLYADPPGGSITVEGGYFANCGISCVRLRGDSLVSGAHIRCDSTERGFDNMRGIRLTDYESQLNQAPTVVEDCFVEVIDVTHSDAAIELSSLLNEGIIRNTHVHVDADDVAAIRAKSPGETLLTANQIPQLRCENVTITGSGSEEAAVLITERDQCSFDELCIHQTGVNRNGIELRRSADAVVSNSYINVTGEPIELSDSTVDSTNLRTQPVETASHDSPNSGHCE